MLKRYTREVMGRIWSEDHAFALWVIVEVAVLRAKVAAGVFPGVVPADLEKFIQVTAEQVQHLEDTKTRHNVKAFLELTEPQLPPVLQSEWHKRMTSNDVMDTALGLQLQESVRELKKTLGGLMDALKNLAKEHKYAAMAGRTHLVHAEPITFGVTLAVWHDECQRNMERLERLEKIVSFGKLSGAVGMFTIPPKVEELMCTDLGLYPIIATQIVGRDIIAEYLSVLAIIAGTVSKIADNIRHMQSTEIREAQEYFDPNQTGSSAMPHKRNPIASENTMGITRVIRGNAGVGLANQDDQFQRILPNSSTERIVLPDSSVYLDYVLGRMTKVLAKLIVYPKRMKANLQMTRGLVFSEDVQSLIADKGVPRNVAYDLVKPIAQRCWEDGSDFCEALLADHLITQHVTPEEVRSCFNLGEKLKHVDYIFTRVFGEDSVEVEA